MEKVPMFIVKFMLSHTFILGNHAHRSTKIQEHYFEISTSHTSKGNYLSLRYKIG